MLRRPGLWKHVRKWDRIAGAGEPTTRLASGALVLFDQDLAHRVMTSQDDYREGSGFLRTRSHAPLPMTVRAELRRSLATAISAHDLAPPPSHGPSPKGSRPEVRLAPHTWGVRSLQRYFAPVIATDRPAALARLVEVYIREKVIGDDISGRLRRMPEDRRDDVFERTGEIVGRSPVNSTPNDLVDVAAPLAGDLPPIEVGELYLRLVHSLLGFTATALEFATLLAAEDRGFRDAARQGRPLRPRILEAQRLYPTAWRLVREATVEHRLGDHVIAPGDRVVVATSALHRHPQYWPRARAFDPDRWRDPATLRHRAYLPFGRGQRMCPGREVALDAITSLVGDIHRSYDVTVAGSPARRPYVRALIAAPPRAITLRPRGERQAG